MPIYRCYAFHFNLNKASTVRGLAIDIFSQVDNMVCWGYWGVLLLGWGYMGDMGDSVLVNKQIYLLKEVLDPKTTFFINPSIALFLKSAI